LTVGGRLILLTYKLNHSTLFQTAMKRTFLSLFCAGALLATSACSNDSTTSTTTPTDSEEAGGNAGDNYMNAATDGYYARRHHARRLGRFGWH
jgi:hypothetical protein